MDDLSAFKSRVEAFLVMAGMSPSRFGTSSCCDSAFVLDLRSGREPRFSTIAKVNRFMDDWKAKNVPDHPSAPGTSDAIAAAERRPS